MMMKNFFKTFFGISFFCCSVFFNGCKPDISAESVPVSVPLDSLQQAFLDLRFGMFIHYNMPTYSIHDWPDPNMAAELFSPTQLDCNQWADAALSAGMTYGCLTTKHHSGFCVWNTQTTDYHVGNTPYGKDVVRQYVDAFRSRG
ncbi:MAG: alpha-L-fucosidase, partial [Bacteroidales bacterium]